MNTKLKSRDTCLRIDDNLIYSPLEPARIIEGPQDTKVIHGEDVVLFCRASGNPEPQVTFLWNSQELGPSISESGSGIHSSGMIVRPLPKGSGLTLRAKLQMSNNGDTVTCRVYNQFGTDSTKARITVYDANEPPPKGLPKITENPTTTIGQVGDSTHLQCEVSATPAASVVWIKDTFFPLDLSDSRYRLIGSGSLVIESLLEEDSGVYECMAQNIIGTAISNAGHLNVRRIEFPPAIKEIPSQVFVSPGKGTNLTCKASGFPLPLVWWATTGSAPIVPPGGGKSDFHETSPIHYYTERPLTKPQAQQATLRLTDITDQLTYICVAKNSLGIVRRNISVIVKPLPDPPTWIDARPVGGTYAVLQWKAHKVSEIESYTLTVESKKKRLGSLMDLRRQMTDIYTKDFHTSLSDDSQIVTFNVTDLFPYTTYKATVQAVNKRVGLSLPSEEMEFQTAEIPPGEPPQDIRMRVSGPTSLEIAWDAPQLSNGKILGYKVYYTTRKAYPLSARQVKRTPNQKIRLEDLLPNATYIVSISPYNAAGDGPMSEDHYSLILPGAPLIGYLMERDFQRDVFSARYIHVDEYDGWPVVTTKASLCERS
ncbi:Receptor-type tyrosine-protein phosphatase F [Taenia solium]|eukprot:TsM_000756100 transcript=TsM_000756100 gene=TsM_000756100